MNNLNVKKYTYTIFFIILVIFNIKLLFSHEPSNIVSSITILFHEAGHLIFSFFGSDFLSILGGSLVEVGVPLIFVFYFLKNKNKYGYIFSLWWVSVSLYSVAIYMRDARALKLDLIAGLGPEAHDWRNIFTDLGILDKDIIISNMVMYIFFLITIYICVLIYDLFKKPTN